MRKIVLLAVVLMGFASCQFGENKNSSKNKDLKMTNLEIVRQYFSALENGDMAKVASLFADDLVWHQPGKGVQSGTFTGKQAVFAHLGKLAEWSGSDLGIKVDYLADNGAMVVASIRFALEKNGVSMAMRGVDLLRLEDGLIKEVWLFSERIEEEEAFWTSLSNKK
ncbi:hypothetical protein PGIN_7BTORR_00568 [Porphyromonas gingivalis]|uniref:nuclear transport factor 2 family protein n=1 Tax=Porphyromonas gingivalis TaxID=837 RepID=UPI000974F94F|nr:nuclear transport factor 2 family protein [Porphyromonas gingivalis]SJL23186.1 hypothetical protein PGIN_7BTORR_00568 [Porphyromonas gingivalis]